jgi:pimeloyl-ACP methyl ester carboxylesterase
MQNDSMTLVRSKVRGPALMVLGAAIVAAGCAPGFRYTHAPPLPLHQIDYGFPVRTALQNPQVAYVDQGSGENTLILIHGLAGNAGFWRYNIPELAEHARVIAVDLPGYGHSQKSTAYPYTMSFYAATLARLIDELQLQNVTLVGHSMGGQIAMTLALRRPEQVQGLVLVAPAGIESFERGEGEWLRNALTIRGMRLVPEDGIRRNLANNFYNWSDRWEWMVEERARMAKAPDFDQFAFAVVRSVGGMIDEPTTARLGAIRQPTTIVYGRYDWLIPNPYLNPGRSRDVFERGAREIPNARLVEIDNAGHMVIVEQASGVNRAIREHLQR